MPDVRLDLERALYLRMVEEVRGTKYSMNNIFVGACRRLIGQMHPDRPATRGQQAEMRSGGPEVIPEGDPLPFNGNLGPTSRRLIQEYADQKGRPVEEVMVTAIEAYLERSAGS